MSCKKLLLVRSEILGLFVNTFTAEENYSCHNRENFPQQFQMISSQKPKTFSWFFIVFLKSTSKSEYFDEKDESHGLIISDTIDSGRGG